MREAVKLSVMALGVATAAAVTSFAVAASRPAVPQFVVAVKGAADATAPALMLIYDENGGDPWSEGTLGRGRRIADCKIERSLCVSPSRREGFGVGGRGTQSLQVRLFNGSGNPIVGGVHWTGRSHPKTVRLTCDLDVRDPKRACAVNEVVE